MYIQQGKPIPDELQPLSAEVYNSFFSQTFKPTVFQEANQLFSRNRTEWAYMQKEARINFLQDLHLILFPSLVPLPITEITYDRIRFVATFHSDDWSMRFSGNYFKEYNCEQVVKVWIHETFHAILHFASLRLNPEIAIGVLIPPVQIIDLAKQKGNLNPKSSLLPIAKRNLLGMLDRSMGNTAYQHNNSPNRTRAVLIKNEFSTNLIPLQGQYANLLGIGLDSYYLNVEINVENLTEILFKKLIPIGLFRRSYPAAQEYIKRRLAGIAPAFAAQN